MSRRNLDYLYSFNQCSGHQKNTIKCVQAGPLAFLVSMTYIFEYFRMKRKNINLPDKSEKIQLI